MAVMRVHHFCVFKCWKLGNKFLQNIPLVKWLHQSRGGVWQTQGINLTATPLESPWQRLQWNPGVRASNGRKRCICIIRFLVCTHGNLQVKEQKGWKQVYFQWMTCIAPSARSQTSLICMTIWRGSSCQPICVREVARMIRVEGDPESRWTASTSMLH